MYCCPSCTLHNLHSYMGQLWDEAPAARTWPFILSELCFSAVAALPRYPENVPRTPVSRGLSQPQEVTQPLWNLGHLDCRQRLQTEPHTIPRAGIVSE